MRVLFRVFVAFMLLALSAAAQPAFHYQFDPETSTWSLSNGIATAVFQLASDGHFEFRRLTDSQGREWVPPDRMRSSLFNIRTDTDVFDAGTAFRMVSQSARSIARRGYRQTIVLQDLQARARVIVDLDMFENQPALRYRVRFRNLRPGTARIRHIDLLPWSFDDADHSFRVFRVNQWVSGGKRGNFEPLEDSLDGAGAPVRMTTGAYGQQCAWLALRDDSNRGLFAGLEFDGRTSIEIRHTGDADALQISAVIQEMSRPVGANEELILPAAFVGLFQGDWDEAGYRTQRFAEAAIARPAPDRNFPYVMWDSWKYQTGIDEYTLRRNAEIAARIGIEVFVVDLGWARQIGDWHADPRKFPSGMRALSDYVHSLGMKFGLHFAFAEATETSPVLRANPGWTSTIDYGYFGAVSLCLSHQPVRDWVITEAVRMIDEYNVDWILQDGENMVKVCTKTSHTHDPFDSNFSNAVDGLNAVVAAIQEQRPRVLWENCEDGGNMMTYNMVRRYNTSIAADDSGPLTTRQAVYGITYPFPPRYADRYMPDDEIGAYVTRSFMFGGPWIFMTRLEQMRPEDLEFAAGEIRIYKSIRRRMRDGKVYHLTPRPAEDSWDALQSHHEETDTSVVIVARADTPIRPRVRLRGLDPEKNYRVRFQEDRRNLVMTGRQLMLGGVAMLALSGRWSADIIYVEPMPAPNP